MFESVNKKSLVNLLFKIGLSLLKRLPSSTEIDMTKFMISPDQPNMLIPALNLEKMKS